MVTVRERRVARRLPGRPCPDARAAFRLLATHRGGSEGCRSCRLRQDHKDALENPPLLVVSDLDRIEVYTNFAANS